MKVAIFGGTFSPPHTSHVNILSRVQRALCGAEIIVTVASVPPHKECYESADERLQMARLAFAPLGVTVSDFELTQAGSSYTYKTLQHFKYARNLKSCDELFFVLGGDSLRDFGTWKNPELIAELATLVVYPRPGCDAKADAKLLPPNAKVIFLESGEAEDVSSTIIRCDYQFGITEPPHVAPEVDAYIRKKGLYAEFLPYVKQLKAALSAERFDHTYEVVRRALTFPWSLKSSFRDKFLAALLHDCAKEISPKLWEHYGYACPAGTPPAVTHAHLGALVAKKDYGITDENILDAIKYHTTARIGMTELDKIVYVADKTEKSRPFDTEILIKKTLDETFFVVLGEIQKYNQKHPKHLDPATQQAYDYYKNLSNHKE